MIGRSGSVAVSAPSACSSIVHRRQFIAYVGNDPKIAHRWEEGWQCFRIRQVHVWCHPDLRTLAGEDATGQEWLLVGTALQCDPNLPRIPNQLCATGCDDVGSLTYGWAGRWVLITSHGIATDAAALMGVYYGHDTEGRLWFSSAVSLLSEVLGADVRDKRLLGWYGMNWFPPPLTRRSGICKLLPDQLLLPGEGCLERLSRFQPSNWRGLSTQERGKEILNRLRHLFRALASVSSQPIAVALTGGLDSRTTFSAACTSEVGNLCAITIEHPRMSDGDRRIPVELCRKVGVPHHSIPLGYWEHTRIAEFDRHTDEAVIDGDREFFAKGGFDGFLAKPCWLIRSGCWEIGRNELYGKLAATNLAEIVHDPKRVTRSYGNFVGTCHSDEALKEWALWRNRYAEPYDWKDMFYRDQRLGGWLSAIEQSLDLIEACSFQPANSAAIYDLLLSADESDRESGAVQKEVIRQSGTGFERTDINPPSGSLVKMGITLAKLRAIFNGEVRNLMR